MGISSKNNGLSLGSTPSHGNPTSTSALNTELNNVARNTDDTAKARALVEAGADLSSTNGPTWRHTPLHQAAFHGRYNMAACLVELGAPLQLPSNPCGRGATGTPLELARGGGHKRIAEMIERAIRAGGRDAKRAAGADGGSIAEGRWEVYHNIDMCFQGDAEIIHDWKRHTSIAKLKKIVEEKNYSAVCVGSFGHAALKSFDYQLTKEHCKPSQGYTNELHVWFPTGAAAKPPKVETTRSAAECLAAGWSRSEIVRAGLAVQVGETLVSAVPGNRDGTATMAGSNDKHNTSLEPFEIPTGWRLVSRSHPEFERIRTKGIARNGWAAYVVFVAKDEAGTRFASYRTDKHPEGPPGTVSVEDSPDLEHLGGRRYRATNMGCKFLITPEDSFAVSSTGHGGAAEGDKALLDGHYFSFKTGGDPHHVVDRFEVRQAGNRVTYYRNGHVGSTGRVDPATAHACESYEIRGDQLIGPVTATVQTNGDITYSHGYTSRKEDVSATGQRELMAKSAGGAALDSYGSDFDGSLAEPLAHAAWNGNLGHVRSLLDRGAPPNTEAHNGFSNGHHSALNGASRNGHAAIVKLLLEQPVKPDIESRCQDPWAVTPLQQAAYHGRAECAKILLEHGASTTSRSGPGCNNKTAKEIAKAMRNAEWQELVAAIDAHSELTLKRAARRISAPTAQKYQRTSSSLGSDGERPLVETVDVLRRELALKGTVAQVVKQACVQLGVDTVGNALTQQANECWEIVMGK